MRIIYPIYLSLPSPLARSIQIVNTCHALASEGVAVDLLCAKGVKLRDVVEYYGFNALPENFNIHGLPALIKTPRSKIRFSTRAPWDWGVKRYVKKAIKLAKRKNQEAPVVYLRELKTAKALLPLIKQHQLNAVYEAHHVEYRMGEIDGKSAKEVEEIRELEADIYRTVKTIIAITDAVGESLKHDFDTLAPILVLPNGCTPPTLAPEMIAKDYLFYAGQLYDWKGVDTIIEMMQYLPDERLVIAGGAQEKDMQRCKGIALQYGVQERVEFLGQLSHGEIPQHACRAKVLLLPNKDQLYNQAYTSPIKLFEYLNYGKPIVASDLATIRQIVTHESEALLVQADNAKAFAAAITRLNDDADLCSRLGAAATKLAPTYTWQARAKKLLCALEKNSLT